MCTTDRMKNNAYQRVAELSQSHQPSAKSIDQVVKLMVAADQLTGV